MKVNLNILSFDNCIFHVTQNTNKIKMQWYIKIVQTTVTVRNLHICDNAFFAYKFVWYGSQIRNGNHNILPKCHQLFRALNASDKS